MSGAGASVPGPAGALETLARRAARSPEDPFLFFQRGWDWHWRSYAQVADQVARGADLLRRRQVTSAGPLEVAALRDPDGIAVGLAVEAAGGVAVPGSSRLPSAALTVRPASGGEAIELPACRPRLERWRPRPLEPGAQPGGWAADSASEGVRAADLDRAAAALDRLLPPGVALRGRPILCADPELETLAPRALLAWTLVRDAAWALEPEAGAFVATVLWTRPTVVVAGAPACERLAAAFAERRARRHARLRAAVVAGAGDVADAARRALEELGVAIVRWSPGEGRAQGE